MTYDLIFSIVIAVIQLIFVVVCVCRGNSSGLKTLSKTILELYTRWSNSDSTVNNDNNGNENNVDISALTSLVAEKILEVLRNG